MKARKIFTVLAVTAALLPTGVAFADFTGNFSGFYAPANWTIATGNNPTFEGNAVVDTTGAPAKVIISGASGPGLPIGGNLPVSTVDYEIVLDNTATSVSFGYTFINPGFAGDMAQIFDNGSLLTTLGAASSVFISRAGQFHPGDMLDLRVTSVNVSQVDSLQVGAVPEPSTLALAGLGGAALWLKMRRKSASRKV
jgi:hypothetical protein